MPGPSLDPACAASSEIARFAPCLAMSLKRLVARHAAADAAAAAEAAPGAGSEQGDDDEAAAAETPAESPGASSARGLPECPS